jgi:hypothetical protein
MPSEDTTTVRAPRRLIEDLRTIATANERSLTGELRVALDTYVRAELAKAKRRLAGRSR